MRIQIKCIEFVPSSNCVVWRLFVDDVPVAESQVHGYSLRDNARYYCEKLGEPFFYEETVRIVHVPKEEKYMRAIKL